MITAQPGCPAFVNIPQRAAMITIAIIKPMRPPRPPLPLSCWASRRGIKVLRTIGFLPVAIEGAFIGGSLAARCTIAAAGRVEYPANAVFSGSAPWRISTGGFVVWRRPPGRRAAFTRLPHGVTALPGVRMLQQALEAGPTSLFLAGTRETAQQNARSGVGRKLWLGEVEGGIISEYRLLEEGGGLDHPALLASLAAHQ